MRPLMKHPSGRQLGCCPFQHKVSNQNNFSPFIFSLIYIYIYIFIFFTQIWPNCWLHSHIFCVCALCTVHFLYLVHEEKIHVMLSIFLNCIWTEWHMRLLALPTSNTVRVTTWETFHRHLLTVNYMSIPFRPPYTNSTHRVQRQSNTIL